jgi:hypothetical protein
VVVARPESSPPVDSEGGRGSIPELRLLRRTPDVPLGPTLLVLLGGLFLCVEGIVLALGRSVSGPGSPSISGVANGVGAASLVLGVVLILVALLIYRARSDIGLAGVFATILSIASLFVGGGFVVGAILGIVGGILAIAWTAAPSFYVAPLGLTACPDCGSAITSDTATCPNCDR